MNRTKSICLPVAAVLIAIVLTLLRRWELNSAFDADGVPIHGSVATWVLLAAVVVAAALWILLSRVLTPTRQLVANRSFPAGILCLAGAALIALSSIVSLFHHSQRPDLFAQAADICGLIAALCLCVSACLTLIGRTSHAAVHIVPYLFLLLRLVSDFRGWSIDPVILDYCFRHFGLIFSLCGLYCMASLHFGEGKRRLTTFWAMGAVGFCTMSCLGVQRQDLLLYLGLALTLLSAVVQLSSEKATA